METDVNQDFEDYWNEYKIIEQAELLDRYLEEIDDQSEGFDEAEHETEWLVAAGLPHIVESYLQGKEVKDADLSTSLRSLPMHQADAVRRRVKTLNNTIKKRAGKSKKPDIRDVFKPAEEIQQPLITKEEKSTESLYIDDSKTYIDRSKKWQNSILSSVPIEESLFAQNHKGDVASDYNGVKIVSYQSIGTLHLPRPVPYRKRVFTDTLPTEQDSQKSRENENDKLNPHIDDLASDFAHWNEISNLSEYDSQIYSHSENFQSQSGKLGRTWIEYLGENDICKLRPLLLLEVTALFDSCHINFHIHKPLKRKLKEGGNVFGISLTTLTERDRHLRNEPSNVPLVFEKVLNFLEKHGTRDEGILRLAGHQQKVEILCNKIEHNFYSQPKEIDQLLQPGVVTAHDIATVLKRLLRDLPIPLLTVEYLSAFYNCHGFLDNSMKYQALNLLVLLLPMEYSSTLRALLKYLTKVSSEQVHNKMTIHNIAMIMAPSLFNPSILSRFVLNNTSNKQKLATQVDIAAKCCQVVESLLICGESLWIVPHSLISQIRKQNEEERYRQLGSKENSKPTGNQIKWLLGKKYEQRDWIARKIDNEVDFQNGVIRVDSPQFMVWKVPVKLTSHMTASEVVLRVVEEAVKRSDVQDTVVKNARPNPRALADLAPNGNLSCILSTAYPEMTLQSHFLYEIGGNIARRQVEHTAIVLDVYKENPNTQWTLRCHHRNANDQNFGEK